MSHSAAAGEKSSTFLEKPKRFGKSPRPRGGDTETGGSILPGHTPASLGTPAANGVQYLALQRINSSPELGILRALSTDATPRTAGKDWAVAVIPAQECKGRSRFISA